MRKFAVPIVGRISYNEVMATRIQILASWALLSVSCAQSADAPYRGNDGRSGEYAAPGVAELEQIVWKHRSPGALAGPVAIGGDAVFVVATDGMVSALEVADGSVRWQTDLDVPVFGIPVVAGKRLLVGTDRGLAAVALDGKALWSYDGAPIDGAPLVVDSVAYVGDRSGRMLAIDVVGGSLIWEALTAGPIALSAVRLGDDIAVGSHDGRVYSLDRSTGEPRWSFSAGAAVRGLAASDDRLYVTAGRALLAINPKSPEAAAWRVDLGGRAETPPSLSGGLVVAGTGSGQLVGLDTTDGSPLFRKDLGRAIRGDISVTTGRLVVPVSDGGVEVVDRAGKALWHFRTDGRTVGVTPIERRLYVTDSAGSIYALE